MSKNAVLMVYSDNNLGDLAIVLSRIQKLSDKNITLFSVYNKYQKKFISEHNKLRKHHQVYPNPYGELGLDTSNKIFSDLIKVIHFLILPFVYFYHRISIALNLNTSVFINKIKHIDNFYLKGGSIFESYGSKRELISLLRIWFLLSLIKKNNKNIFFDPQSFGPFRSKLSSFVFKKILSLSDKIICREKISLRYLERYFKPQNLNISHDIVFDYKFNVETQIIQENKIGITLVASKLNNSEYINIIKSLINKLSNYFDTYDFVIIRQVDLNKYDSSEMLMETEIINFFKGKINFEVKKDFNTIEDIYKTYKSLRFLIGSRLHSTIISFLAKTPFISIEYQGFKARGTYSLLNLNYRVFSIKTLSEFINYKENKFTQCMKILESSEDLILKKNEKENSN